MADEFRDGNVPARQAPLACAQLAFAALPETIQTRYFRGDSACHGNELIGWLKHPDRQAEKGGRIGFAVSAVMSGELAAAIAKVEDKDWRTFATEADGTLRQWAEVVFVPSEASEKKDSQPNGARSPISAENYPPLTSSPSVWSGFEVRPADFHRDRGAPPASGPAYAWFWGGGKPVAEEGG